MKNLNSNIDFALDSYIHTSLDRPTYIFTQTIIVIILEIAIQQILI